MMALRLGKHKRREPAWEQVLRSLVGTVPRKRHEARVLHVGTPQARHEARARHAPRLAQHLMLKVTRLLVSRLTRNRNKKSRWGHRASNSGEGGGNRKPAERCCAEDKGARCRPLKNRLGARVHLAQKAGQATQGEKMRTTGLCVYHVRALHCVSSGVHGCISLHAEGKRGRGLGVIQCVS